MKHEGSLRQTTDEPVIGGAYDLTREADDAGGQPQPWHCLRPTRHRAITSCSFTRTKTFSTGPSAASRLPRSRMEKAHTGADADPLERLLSAAGGRRRGCEGSTKTRTADGG